MFIESKFSPLIKGPHRQRWQKLFDTVSSLASVSVPHKNPFLCDVACLLREYVTCILLQENSISPREQELRDLKQSLEDTQPVGSLVKCCKTLDQVIKIWIKTAYTQSHVFANK